MSNIRGTQVTYAGLNLLAACQTGTELHFTRVVMGDGKVADDQNMRQLTGLVSPKLTLPIKSVKVTGVGTTVLETELKNQNLAQGFHAREVGIFATGSDGTEILYAVRNTGDDSEYVPAGGGSEVWDLIYDVVTVVDQADNITATINGDIAYITRVDFQEHSESADHPYFGPAATTGTTLLTADDTGNKLHRISLDDTRTLILGDSAATIPVLRSRVSQLEIDQANMALKMQAETDLPDLPLLLAEDFTNPDKIDTYSVKVNSAVAGDNGIDIQTDYGVITGAWYWISDGINQEYIQIKAVIKNGSVYRVLATDNLKNTYNLPATYMYRTTSMILDGTASGSGDRKGFQWIPNADKWTGKQADSTATNYIQSTQKNASEFNVLEGNIYFTADGKITIGGND